MAYAVSFRDLRFRYDKGPWILKDYTCEIQSGAVFAVLGPNGRGKTTLLKLILGLLKPNRGKIHVIGQTSLVPQLFQVTFAFTVLDMVLMGRSKKIGLFSRPNKKDIAAAKAALDHFGMADMAERTFLSLSGGQRQMAILARSLVSEADILIMDEPTSALDLNNQSMVLSWMEHLSKKNGLTVIFTTHQPQHALAVANKSLLILNEKEYYCGNTKDILSEINLQTLYGLPVRQVEFKYKGSTITTLAPVYLHK